MLTAAPPGELGDDIRRNAVDLELVERARSRRSVGAPSMQSRRVAKSIAVDLVDGDLDNRRRPERDPVVLHVGRPAGGGPLEPAERAGADDEAVPPRMVLEVDDERRKLVDESDPLGNGQVRDDADVVQPLVLVVEPEDQRADCRPGEQPQTGHDTLHRPFELDLDHRALSRLVTEVVGFRDDAVHAATAIRRQPSSRPPPRRGSRP